MTYKELVALAEQGNLILERTLLREMNKTKYTWNSDNTECTASIVKCKVYFYGARTADMPRHKQWKITKKDYQVLEKILNSKHV